MAGCPDSHATKSCGGEQHCQRRRRRGPGAGTMGLLRDSEPLDSVMPRCRCPPHYIFRNCSESYRTAVLYIKTSWVVLGLPERAAAAARRSRAEASVLTPAPPRLVPSAGLLHSIPSGRCGYYSTQTVAGAGTSTSRQFRYPIIPLELIDAVRWPSPGAYESVFVIVFGYESVVPCLG